MKVTFEDFRKQAADAAKDKSKVNSPYAKYGLGKNSSTGNKSYSNMNKTFCSKCGTRIYHESKQAGKSIGLLSGAASGAYLGAQTGIVAGPLGAIAGTVPGALVGGLVGLVLGKKLDSPKCPACHK